MQEVGEFLERLGRQIGRMERRYGRGAGRFGEQFQAHFGEHFQAHFSDEGDAGDTGPETDVRELVFGEQPELRLKVNLSTVHLRQVEAGAKPRVSARERDLANVEITTADDGAIDIKANHSLFGGSQRLYIYLPAGTRIRANADLGSLTAEGLSEAELDLRTDAGRLRVRDCHGRLRLVSNAGKLDVQQCSGTLDGRASAGKLQVRDFTGTLTAHAEAGSVRCSGLRLEPGEHLIEASMGSIDISLLPDVPIRIETRANMGSVHNRAGDGPADAPAHLALRTDMGSIRVRWEEGEPTPLRQVRFTDERNGSAGSAAQPRPVDPVAMQSVPLSGEPSAETAESTTDPDEETLRILGMVERHEISAGDGAALLAAIKR